MKHFLAAIFIGGSFAASANTVGYEQFGAKGDGVADDLPAVVKVHAHANEHGLPVKSRPDATYHLGTKALTAIIATDTDWGTSRFIIDDSAQEKGYWARNLRITRSKTGDPSRYRRR